MHLYEHQIATNASQQMIKVTEMVREDIERSGVREGIAVIFSPHTMRMQIRMWCMICCVALKKYFRQNSSSTSMQKEIRMHI